VYHYRPPQLADSASPISTLGGLPIPTYISPSPKPGPVPFIPGGGLTRRILSSAGAQWPVPTVAVLQFVMEGDNREDARLMATVVARVLGLVEHLPPNGWKEPPSWGQGLFGTNHDSTLYG
jgi:proteasome assembly chaperone 2